MKYIRTKDGIYKYADYLGAFNSKRYALMDDAKGNRFTMCQEPEELYKVADTIEELCDEFVIVAVDKDKPFLYELNEPVNSPIFDNEEENVHGAIWTDKGLIYVAKMNDEGELELL